MKRKGKEYDSFICYFINNLILLYAIDTIVAIKQEENIYFS